MDWEEFLQEVVLDTQTPKELLAEARRLLDQLQSGVIPAPRALERLRRDLDADPVCGRLQGDGTCAWLRQNFRVVKMPPPQPGKAVMCNRKGSGPAGHLFSSCPGYTKGEKLR